MLLRAHCRMEHRQELPKQKAAHMTDYHPAPGEGAGQVYGYSAAGADRPEALDSAPPPDPVASTVAAEQGHAAFSTASVK